MRDLPRTCFELERENVFRGVRAEAENAVTAVAPMAPEILMYLIELKITKDDDPNGRPVVYIKAGSENVDLVDAAYLTQDDFEDIIEDAVRRLARAGKRRLRHKLS